MLSIRAVGAGAAPLLAALHTASFEPGQRWGADAIALMLAMPGSFALSATVDTTPRGFVLARVAADEAEILTLAVPPAWRRRGIGGALLRAAIGEATGRGAQAMVLEVAAGNAAAGALYAAQGFVGVGRRPRYYADGSDALVLRRAPLDAPPPP